MVMVLKIMEVNPFVIAIRSDALSDNMQSFIYACFTKNQLIFFDRIVEESYFVLIPTALTSRKR